MLLYKGPIALLKNYFSIPREFFISSSNKYFWPENLVHDAAEDGVFHCGEHKLHVVRVSGDGDVGVDLGPDQASGENKLDKVQSNHLDRYFNINWRKNFIYLYWPEILDWSEEHV